MSRTLLSTLIMFAFLAATTAVGQAYQAFEVSVANADPSYFLHNATNGEVTAGTSSGDHHSGETSLHCTGTVQCGVAILAVGYFVRPLALALSTIPNVDWSIRADSLGIDPPPPRPDLQQV